MTESPALSFGKVREVNMAEEGRTVYHGSMHFHEGYGLSRKQREAQFWYDHIRVCAQCREAWMNQQDTVPESQKIEKLSALVQRNHK